MPSEPKMCTCGMMMAGGEPCAAHFPVSVPEERQDDEEEYVETASDFLNRIAYQVPPLTIAAGDKLVALADSLDALAVAVKPNEECAGKAWMDGGYVPCGYVMDGAPRYCEEHQATIHAAITALLDGRTTT